MKIIKERQHHQSTTFFLFFHGEDGCESFSFECDKYGKVDQDKLSDTAKSNYDDCKASNMGGVEESIQNWVEAAIGICQCGGEVELEDFTNTCESCGRDYNSSGQQLAPREQWGEETGEHPADVARIR